MGKYNYTDREKDFNKVLKMNQNESFSLEKQCSSQIDKLDESINSSEALLKSLGYALPAKTVVKKEQKLSSEIQEIKSYDDLVKKANAEIHNDVELEDLLSEKEFQEAYKRLDAIHDEFSHKTSIVNKTDLIFLGIATALQTAKSLLFSYLAEKSGYGNSFNPDDRLTHNDKSIEKEHRRANDEFKEKHESHGHGYWMNILYQTPPYDITKGSPSINRNMGGAYHRIHTLGHDPILGWIFGTANILTDTITFEDFKSNRVIRKPKMMITPESVPLAKLFSESFEMCKADSLNLPAAIFSEGCHLKSDEFTKLGLPVPVLEAINPDFASKLYKSNYDALCFSRDLKIVGASAGISIFIDMIIGLVHGLFNKEKIDKDLYEVRTRKIILISNSIASTSNIIQTVITNNPKNLDIGGLLVTLSHLFMDLRFISRIKEEFIKQELNKDLIKELERLDSI
ncbi:MAG: hypothetical protein Q4P16_05410 [Spirochaetales bacterium]|nr:hypothetical protein [Spirochaetales bacterium]